MTKAQRHYDSEEVPASLEDFDPYVVAGLRRAGLIVTEERHPTRHGRGRPRIGQRVELVIPDDQVAYLDRIAGLDGVSRAELIRRILDGWVNANVR